MQILNILLNPGNDVYYDPKFRSVLEDHMTWLREHPDNHTVVIENAMAYVYAGDLWGALQYVKVPAYLHWVVMRMNGMLSPTDYRPDLVAFTVPTTGTIEQLRSAYKTQHSLKK